MMRHPNPPPHKNKNCFKHKLHYNWQRIKRGKTLRRERRQAGFICRASKATGSIDKNKPHTKRTQQKERKLNRTDTKPNVLHNSTIR